MHINVLISLAAISWQRTWEHVCDHGLLQEVIRSIGFTKRLVFAVVRNKHQIMLIIIEGQRVVWLERA